MEREPSMKHLALVQSREQETRHSAGSQNRVIWTLLTVSNRSQTQAELEDSGLANKLICLPASVFDLLEPRRPVSTGAADVDDGIRNAFARSFMQLH